MRHERGKSTGRLEHRNSTYVQAGGSCSTCTKFVQDAGLTGQGGSFGRPAFFGRNATKTRGGVA